MNVFPFALILLIFKYPGLGHIRPRMDKLCQMIYWIYQLQSGSKLSAKMGNFHHLDQNIKKSRL